VYSTMEVEFDRATPTAAPLVHELWSKHGSCLRRAPSLALDLEDVGGPATGASPATDRYVEAIRVAGADDRERGGARMLGHLYCRYFADLFGGSMLAMPTRVWVFLSAFRVCHPFRQPADCHWLVTAVPRRAIGLAPDTPRHYTFSLPPVEEGGRRAYIEQVYQSLNVAGDGLLSSSGEEEGQQHWDAVIEETKTAFRHNIAVYSEEPMYMDGLRGCLNVATGMLRSREKLFLPVSLKRWPPSRQV
jgi:hypothetical protein